MPLRGDFSIEYDNDAEKLLSDMEFFDDDLPDEIKTKEQILALYNQRLEERIKRKKFVIEHGLLETKKLAKGETEKNKEEKEMYALMRPFMRFCEGNEFNELVEGLIKERNLRKELDVLRFHRSLGLNKIEEIDRYLEKKQSKTMDSIVTQRKLINNKRKQRPNKPKETVIIEEFEKSFCKERGIPEKDYIEFKENMEKELKSGKMLVDIQLMDLVPPGTSPDAVKTMCNYLVGTGFLSKFDQVS